MYTGHSQLLVNPHMQASNTIIVTSASLNRLILIAEKDTVYEKFPTPLINRLEKHFVLTSSVLEEWQSNILEDFDTWIQDFSNTR